MLIMLAGTFFSAISQVLLKQSANMEYKNPPGISELAGDPGLWYLFRSAAPEYLVLHQSGYEIRAGDRYCRLCFCPAVFLADPERKNSRGKIIGNLIIILGILVYTL